MIINNNNYNNKIKKGKLKSLNFKTKILKKGNFGLKSLDYGRLTSKQIETMYMSLNKKLQKTGKIYINIIPNIPVTRKGNNSRMGKGKGNIKYWICKIQPGKILFEINYISTNLNILLNAINYSASKLPFKTKIIILKKFK